MTSGAQSGRELIDDASLDLGIGPSYLSGEEGVDDEHDDDEDEDNSVMSGEDEDEDEHYREIRIDDNEETGEDEIYMHDEEIDEHEMRGTVFVDDSDSFSNDDDDTTLEMPPNFTRGAAHASFYPIMI